MALIRTKSRKVRMVQKSAATMDAPYDVHEVNDVAMRGHLLKQCDRPSLASLCREVLSKALLKCCHRSMSVSKRGWSTLTMSHSSQEPEG